MLLIVIIKQYYDIIELQALREVEEVQVPPATAGTLERTGNLERRESEDLTETPVVTDNLDLEEILVLMVLLENLEHLDKVPQDPL